jgi:hypothetical protein
VLPLASDGAFNNEVSFLFEQIWAFGLFLHDLQFFVNVLSET